MALNSPWNIPQLGQDPLVAALLSQQPMQAAPANMPPNDLTGLSMEQLGEIPVGAGPAIDATQATTQDVGGSYAADMAGVGQKEALAKALMSQAQAPMEQRTAGRFVVANSPLEGLSRVAAGYFGGKAAQGAEEAKTAAQKRQSTALTKLLKDPNMTPEKLYAEMAASDQLSPETQAMGLQQGFATNIAGQKAKYEAEQDERKALAAEKRDEARYAAQDKRDEFRAAAQEARDAAREAGLNSRLGQQLSAQADMLDRRISSQGANREQWRVMSADDVKARGLPAGTWKESSDGDVQPLNANTATSGGGVKLSAKQRQVATDKVQTVKTLKGQLQKMKEAWKDIKDSQSAGMGVGYLPTPEGQAFDATSKNMSSFIRQLTRTPGEGAMSDYESRLAQSILPTRTTHEAVTEQQIQDLEDLIGGIETGYSNLLNPEGEAEAPPADLPSAAAAELKRRRGGK